MSTEAIRHVLDHFPYGGAKLIVMTALADACRSRYEPFVAELSMPALAKKCRNGERATAYTVADLEQRGYLTHEKTPGVLNSYELQIRYPKPLKKPKGVPLKKVAGVIRDDPKSEPRARRTAQDQPSVRVEESTPNVLPFAAQG